MVQIIRNLILKNTAGGFPSWELVLFGDVMVFSSLGQVWVGKSRYIDIHWSTGGVGSLFVGKGQVFSEDAVILPASRLPEVAALSSTWKVKPSAPFAVF